MNKKGILPYDKRYMYLFMLGFTIVIFWLLRYIYIPEINNWKNEILNIHLQNYKGFANGVFIETLELLVNSLLIYTSIPIAIFCAVQWKDLKEQKSGGFIASLPITKTRIFWSKVLMGVLVYTIPWIVFSIGILGTRIQYDGWWKEAIAAFQYAGWLDANQSIGNLMIYLIYIWCVLSLFYGAAVFLQTICKNFWFAGSVSVGIIWFPRLLNNCIGMTKSASDTWRFAWWKSIFQMEGPRNTIQIFDKGAQEYISFSEFPHIEMVIFIMLMLIAALIVLSWFMYVKRDEAKNQGFIYIPWLQEGIFFWLCFEIVMFVLVYGFEIYQEMNLLPEFILIFVVSSIIYFMGVFVRKKRKRREDR